MDPQSVLVGAQDSMAARRVFGEPVSTDGVTILPVAVVSGGGGGGSRADAGGVGFGVTARAAGVFVIRDGHTRWHPAVDVTRIVLGGQLVAITALLVLAPVLDRWLPRRTRVSAPNF